MSTPYGNFRIGDAERMEATDILGRALGEGRLTMAEFDERCSRVAEAQVRSDLTPILSDLPVTPPAAVQPQAPHEVAVYSQAEIMQARRAGKRTRAGIFWLGTVGSVGLTALTDTLGFGALAGMSLLIIPTLFILLYVMRVGPDSWYMPSLRQLEMQRRQELKARQLEIEAAKAQQQALVRAQRQDQFNQITYDALDVAQQTVNRFRRKP